jgi:hypothetical protein
MRRALALMLQRSFYAVGLSSLAQAIQLCRHARAVAGGAQLVVGSWGQLEDAAPAEQCLRAFGAGAVCMTLHETVELAAKSAVPAHVALR